MTRRDYTFWDCDLCGFSIQKAHGSFPEEWVKVHPHTPLYDRMAGITIYDHSASATYICHHCILKFKELYGLLKDSWQEQVRRWRTEGDTCQ